MAKPSASDMREVARGKGSARDRAEATAFNKATRSNGKTSKARKVRKPR